MKVTPLKPILNNQDSSYKSTDKLMQREGEFESKERGYETLSNLFNLFETQFIPISKVVIINAYLVRMFL